MSETITASLTVSGGDVITAEINTLARGPAGPAGEGGSGAITSATTSDGTANLSLSNVTTATATVSGTLTAPHIHGNLAGSVYAHVRAGETLAKGDPVYVSGSHGSGSTLIPIVSKADASNAAKMPAVGIMDAAVANNANGHMVITGTITELNTAAYSINAELYVASGGGFTATPPSARAQPVARVERANTNNGAVLVKVNGLSASDATGSTLVRRTSDGSASFNGINANSIEAGTIEATTLLQTTALASTGNAAFQGSVEFDTTTYTYGDGAAAAHRTALGGGATGVSLFTAASVKVANETLLRTTKIKTTQTNRTLSTTFTTDSDFTIPVTAGQTYRVEFAIYTTATNASGFKAQFTIPSVPANLTGATSQGVGVTTNPGGTLVNLAMTTAGVIGAAALTRGTLTTNGTYHGFFEVTIGTTGGNLLFQWAQASSSADNTSVLANSSVTAIERTP
jgi:hypothetical protein